MFIQIEPQSDTPIYAQVRNGIMEGIVRGELTPGDILPSVRSLAGDLGVNMHTVNKSYHELESKGIIRIVPKSGAVICSPSEKIPTQRLNQISEELRPVLVESLVAGMNEKEITELVTSIILNVKGE
ncbi:MULTISPECIES: GntR family transcriptional regulator [Bacillaceae]|uniref:GntR family transcriptional regulator n=1 Tax=Bacillaceae TaxID=186817 RepID=UPI001C5A1145|nr:GntR family transcriptional regulator [Rossellomorea sp. YZS02]MBW3112178.1 GntR family transcriptional regulator [Bacillus sp. MCCB 382]MDX8342298.1 GntR family transcriptional regulator [Rossellomorea sp. YZS02]